MYAARLEAEVDQLKQRVSPPPPPDACILLSTASRITHHGTAQLRTQRSSDELREENRQLRVQNAHLEAQHQVSHAATRRLFRCAMRERAVGWRWDAWVQGPTKRASSAAIARGPGAR